MLGSGVRDPVPAAADGGALQALLQHLRFAGRLHSGPAGAAFRRREAPGSARAHTLPRLGCRERGPAVPLSHNGDGVVTVHAGFHLLAVRVSDIYLY